LKSKDTFIQEQSKKNDGSQLYADRTLDAHSGFYPPEPAQVKVGRGGKTDENCGRGVQVQWKRPDGVGRVGQPV